MQFRALITFLAVALLGLATTASAASSCKRNAQGGGIFWEIKIDEVEDLGATCHLLWQGLRRHAGCTVLQPNGCGTALLGRKLYMYFTTSLVCSRGNVESAFFHATSNIFGPVRC
ncbi:hypothetical protein CMUS01_10159 [Colletotrichum musicola]|uniref:Uncharacterized protein n=1 Tax=Colletotrichum musicola TaxID=2175873 RepID=A0A8H6K3Z0_9PEZI|nr:hypothetical protein CMUS01_10159 [Colletotrichum musicola]